MTPQRSCWRSPSHGTSGGTGTGHPIRQGNRDGIEWFHIEGAHTPIVTTIGGAPALISGPEWFVTDSDAVGRFIAGAQVVSEDRWARHVADHALDPAVALRGSEILVAGSSDEVAWSVQTNGLPAPPVTTVPDAPTQRPPRDLMATALVIAGAPEVPARQFGFTGDTGITARTHDAEVGVTAADLAPHLDGSVVVLQAPTAAARARLEVRETIHEVPLTPTDNGAIGGTHIPTDDPLRWPIKIELLKPDGSTL